MVSRDRFDAKYLPEGGIAHGVAGIYRNRPVVVLARQMQEPFSIAPDPRYLFMSDRHREALAHLPDYLGNHVRVSVQRGLGDRAVRTAGQWVVAVGRSRSWISAVFWS